MVQAKIELLFSLGDAAEVDGVLVRFEAGLGLVEELDGGVDVGMLARRQDSQLSVFDWVKLVGESLNQGLIQREQVKVFTLVESLVFEVSDEFVTDLVPQSAKNKDSKLDF